MLTDDDIKIILERSFKPYRCVVQLRPNEEVRFKILHGTNQIYVVSPGIELSSLREESLLTALIIKVRAQLKANGYKLEAW